MLSIPAGSYSLSTFFPLKFPEPQGRDLMEASHLGLSVSRPLTLCTLSFGGPLYLFPSTSGGSFSHDCWVSHWSMSRIALLLNSFRRTIAFGFGFPLCPWPIQFRVLGPKNSVGHRYHLMKWTLKPTKQWLVTATTFVPPLNQHVFQARHYCRLKVCSWVGVYISPLVVSRVHEHWSVGVKVLGRLQLNFSLFREVCGCRQQ